jgi:hypothetical protein
VAVDPKVVEGFGVIEVVYSVKALSSSDCAAFNSYWRASSEGEAEEATCAFRNAMEAWAIRALRAGSAPSWLGVGDRFTSVTGRGSVPIIIL